MYINRVFDYFALKYLLAMPEEINLIEEWEFYIYPQNKTETLSN